LVNDSASRTKTVTREVSVRGLPKTSEGQRIEWYTYCQRLKIGRIIQCATCKHSQDMATLQRSHRDASRPIAIDVHDTYKAHHSRGRHHIRRKQSVKQHGSPQSPRPPTVQIPKLAKPVPDEDNAPSLELDFIRQPYDKITLGQSTKIDILVSLRYPQQAPSVLPVHLDYSPFITFATLVAEGRNGERIPMEASAILAQKTCDTIHSFQQPEKQCVAFWHHFPDRLPLGFSSFTDLKITKTGVYRLRTTLMRTGGSAGDGAVSLACIDSMPITVCPPPTRRR
jgi:hypothetical protein